MNYRHAFHAGNFADVMKHLVVTRIVEHLKLKDKAFRVIDTHAGIGLYNLHGGEAERTGEWRDGIGRLVEATPAGSAASLMQPYLDAIRTENEDGALTRYPGSPRLVRTLLRKQDRLTAIELHPQDASRLKSLFAKDVQARIIELDGWLALGAQVPPKEKRGLVLVDPPFEETGEFDRMASGLAKAHRRWPGGIYALWYPIKNRRAVADFRTQLARLEIPKILDLTLEIRGQQDQASLDGSGIVVVNPPWTLADEMRVLLPVLTDCLALDAGGGWSVEWLAGDRIAS